jgi:hypothetical protein
MDTIDITGVNLLKLVKKAYELSKPIGLGRVHFKPNHQLSDDEAKTYILGNSLFRREHQRSILVVAMDYCLGRACKLTVYAKSDRPDRLLMDYPWKDHTHMQFVELLRHAHVNYEGLAKPKFCDHSDDCMCEECQVWHEVGLKENSHGI